MYYKPYGLLPSGCSEKLEYGINHVGRYHLVDLKNLKCYKSYGLVSSGCSEMHEFGVHHMGCYDLVALKGLNML